MASFPNLKLENNLYRFYDDFIGFEDFIVKKDTHYSLISSSKYQWPGYVYNIKANADDCDQLINDFEKKIIEKKIPSYLLVDPVQVPVDFEEKLNQIGIRKIDFWPIIYLDFNETDLHLKNYPDLEIVNIHDPEQLKLWYEIVISVLFPKKSVSFDFFAKRLQDNRYIFQIGYCNGIPATSCMVFMEPDNWIAGTYMGATVNQFRKRGFGAEFHKRALIDAKKAGCLYATGQSSRMGFPLWQQIGFISSNTLDVYWMIGEQFK